MANALKKLSTFGGTDFNSASHEFAQLVLDSIKQLDGVDDKTYENTAEAILYLFSYNMSTALDKSLIEAFYGILGLLDQSSHTFDSKITQELMKAFKGLATAQHHLKKVAKMVD